MSIHFFLIRFADIEVSEKIGHHSTTIPLGHLEHLSTYVVGANAPESSEEQAYQRSIRQETKSDLISLLQQFKKNSARMPLI